VSRPSAETSTIGVSFVVPVRNGAAWIRETLESIFAQADSRPLDVIVVDDRSSDRSAAVLRRLQTIWPIRIVDGEGRGAAAADAAVRVRAAYGADVVCEAVDRLYREIVNAGGRHPPSRNASADRRSLGEGGEPAGLAGGPVA